jgi:hypothetical protein
MLWRGMASWADAGGAGPEPAIQDTVSVAEGGFTWEWDPAHLVRGIGFSRVLGSAGIGSAISCSRTTARWSDHVSPHRGRADRRDRGTHGSESALISLLPRLNDPPPGTVFIDGVDVATSRWRCFQAPSAVCRRSRSCSRTIADNVAFGLDARVGERLRTPAEDEQIRGEVSASERALIGPGAV